MGYERNIYQAGAARPAWWLGHLLEEGEQNFLCRFHSFPAGVTSLVVKYKGVFVVCRSGNSKR
jgi:hypothetical protein